MRISAKGTNTPGCLAQFVECDATDVAGGCGLGRLSGQENEDGDVIVNLLRAGVM